MIKWIVWLFFLVVSFTFLEGFSLIHGTETFSRFVWDLTIAWPPLPYITGFIGGFLCCHFYWGGIVSFKPVKDKDKAKDG